jgi:integrase
LPARTNLEIELARAHSIANQAHVIDVADDDSAISVWLRSKSQSVHTQRSYRREAARLLAFLTHVKGPRTQQLPAMTMAEALDFVAWLQRPYNLNEAALVHLGLTRQPVSEGLAPTSLAQAVVILSSMYQAMREMRGPSGPYCQVDPFHLAKSAVSKAARMDRVEGHELGKALPIEAWREVLHSVELLPRGAPRQDAVYWQTWWLLRLYYFTLCRKFEVLDAQMSDVRPTRTSYSLHVLGKGSKRAQVDVLAPLMNALRTYRVAMGMTPVPSPTETLPLVLHHAPPGGDRTRTISRMTAYRRVTQIFRATAERLAAQGFDEHAVAKLRQANVHWIRHTGISHMLDMGASQRYVQRMARHASLDTTALYDHTRDTLRTADLNAAAEKISRALDERSS